MSSLTSLQGNGGGRIPMDGFVYDVSRQDLTALIEAMPSDACRTMHQAVRQGDRITAQKLLREAAASYFATTPAALAASITPTRRTRCSIRPVSSTL